MLKLYQLLSEKKLLITCFEKKKKDAPAELERKHIQILYQT